MKKLTAVLIFGLTLGFGGVQANAATQATTSQLANAVGLVIEYRDGVAPVSANGSVTGENFAGVSLHGIHSIGAGLYAASFEGPMADAEAKLVAKNLELDPRVLSVKVDHDTMITAQSIQATSDYKLAVALGTVLRAPSAPVGVKVVDALSSTAPTQPRIKVTWGTPRSLFGGKLSGFQIWKAVGSAAPALALKVTNPKARAAYVSTGLLAGRSTKFTVRAVTTFGTAIKIGTPSIAISFVPTAVASVPKLAGYTDEALKRPTWQAQSLYERGGLPVTYQVTATAPGRTSLTCTTTSLSCQLGSFSSASDYTLSLVAINDRGTSKADAAVRARDPYFYQQWYLFGKYGINAPGAWAQLPSTYTNSVVVAVIDSGIAPHSDLDSQLVAGYDFVSLDMTSNDGDGWDTDASDPGSYETTPTPTVSSWHGTHVAGLIAAAANGEGIVGVAPGVKLQSVRALGATGGKESDLFAAITWASGGTIVGVPANATPAKVINISMGTSVPSGCGGVVQGAMTDAIARGVTIVTSAGNGNTNNIPMPASNSYPGNCLGSINVGATGAGGDASYYSNYGLAVDISAPGGDDRVTEGTSVDAKGSMISTFNTGDTVPAAETYAFDEGTSMAAPMVSGVVALIYAKKANVTVQQVWGYLKAGVKKFAPGTDCALTVGTDAQRCGAGILDANATLKLVK